MSRIGKYPVEIPKGVDVKIDGTHVVVKGPKGTLERDFPPLVKIELENGSATVVRTRDDRNGRSMHGLSRSLLQNMVQGVVEPFKRSLEISGVGYRAELKGEVLNLQVGLSHEVNYELPEGVTCTVDKQTTIHLESPNKEIVGQAAAKIRGFRPTEPYKGKGIKYAGERVRRKEGKTGSK
jgi:large subunit ribosomal protein L6